MKLEYGKWYAKDWKGPMIFVEWWNGNFQRLALKDARLEECGKEYGIKRWCLLPDDTVNETGFQSEDITMKTEFILTLFDDAVTRHKLEAMSKLEVMLDDNRNVLPPAYYRFTDEVPMGSTIKVTLELVSSPVIQS